MRPALLAALLAELLVHGCASKPGAAGAPDASIAIALEALVEVTVEAECARLAAGKPAGAVNPFLRDALEKRGLRRAGYDEAARLHPEALRLVDARLSDCRARAGYHPRPLDGGVVWEKLPP